jgi:hypothetical protein
MRTPGDYLGYGALVWLVGGMLVALAVGSQAPSVLVVMAATVPGVIGGVSAQIGVIAWGVRTGMRAVRADEYGARYQAYQVGAHQ